MLIALLHDQDIKIMIVLGKGFKLMLIGLLYQKATELTNRII